MDKKQSLLTVVLAMAAGFGGGVVSSRVLPGSPVFVQPTPEPEKIIQAEQLWIVDKDRQVRASLGVEGEGEEPVLEFYEKPNSGRETYVQLHMFPYPQLMIGTEGAAAWFGLAGGQPFLALDDKDGKSRAGLSLSSNGEPSLTLDDKNGKTRATLRLVDGEPILALYDEKEKARAGLGLDNGEPSLELDDKNGKTRATLGSTELNLKRTGSVERRPPASLVLFGEDGKVMWEAP